MPGRAKNALNAVGRIYKKIFAARIGNLLESDLFAAYVAKFIHIFTNTTTSASLQTLTQATLEEYIETLSLGLVTVQNHRLSPLVWDKINRQQFLQRLPASLGWTLDDLLQLRVNITNVNPSNFTLTFQTLIL